MMIHARKIIKETKVTTHTQTAITKATFRKSIKAKMQKRFCIYEKKCATKILSLITAYKKPKAYKTRRNKKIFYTQAKQHTTNILLYTPLQSEVDITGVLRHLRAHKKYQVFIPKLEKDSFNMVKYRFPLVKNNWHIYEPKHCNIYKNIILDIAIVPTLGIDKNMKRIGFGKGMYDRFYARLKTRPYTIFTSRYKQIANASLCDDYDIYADIYVSAYK